MFDRKGLDAAAAGEVTGTEPEEPGFGPAPESLESQTSAREEIPGVDG